MGNEAELSSEMGNEIALSSKMGNEAELSLEMGNKAKGTLRQEMRPNLAPKWAYEVKPNLETRMHHLRICLTAKLSEARTVIASEVEHPNSNA